MDRDLTRLTEMASDVRKLESELKKKREARNRLALRLVARGQHSLRQVAEHAGIKNPYLVELRKKLNN